MAAATKYYAALFSAVDEKTLLQINSAFHYVKKQKKKPRYFSGMCKAMENEFKKRCTV